MITFIDEKSTEHSALVAYSVTKAVNGELSVKGTIYTNDKVLHGIDRGWRFRLDDEYYRVTYAKPNDAGRQIEVEFDAVHQFFYDMSKSILYEILDGSNPLKTYLDAIFSGSGYTYSLEESVGSIRKENFGNKSRLSLFNDIIKSAGLEFSVRGHVVRILRRIGTDLSAIVRKDFNMNELKIEKNINSFVTYQRGLGAWKDDEDHSKGRYESEYESPLAKIYGRIEAEPVVDERYKETGKLLERLKENVDKSYKVSVEIDMEDLSRAGYRLSRPNPGDFIMAINETLGFRQKVRIVSFTSEYDVGGNLISRKVVCNDIGSVQRRASEMSSLIRSAQDTAVESTKAIATATKALVSADGKNTVYFGATKPRDEPVGTLRKGDQLYLKEGEKTNLYFWNGAEWELNPLEMDFVKFRKEYESKTKEIDQSMIEQSQKTAEALKSAGANASAIEAAKGAITKLNQDLAGAKTDLAQAQSQLSGSISQIRSDVGAIRNQQTIYEQSNTQSLARITGQLGDKASKAEVKQTADRIREEIASLSVGGRNLLGVFNTHCVKSTFDIDTYRLSGKTDKNTNTTSLQLQFLWTDGSYTSVITINTLGAFCKAFKIKKIYKEFIVKYNSNKEDAKLICRDPELLKLNEDYLFTGVLSNLSPNDSVAEYLKIEKGTLPSDWSKAPEDAESLITEAKATFERTAQGLRTDLTAVQSYVSADGARTEALQKYSREETARQLTAERKLIEAGYVAKATYTEDAKSINRRFEELKSNSETKLAEYKQAVDGRFATITIQLNNKANQTDFQKVQETTKLYERIIGSTESDVVSKVSKMVMSNSLFQVEVSKNEGLKTVQSQLVGSWAVQNLNSAGDLISGLNLGANGVNRLDGRLTHITGQTLIDNAVIKSAMIESVLADKITAGTLNAANVNIINLNANKIVGLDATFLRGKIGNAIIDWLIGKTIVSQNGTTVLNLQTGKFTLDNEYSSITFRRSSDNTKTEFNKNGIAFLQNQKVIAVLEQGYNTSIYENSTQKCFRFGFPNEQGLAFTTQGNSTFFEINPQKKNLSIQSEFTLLIGGRTSQSVSLEHRFGNYNGVNFSSFRAKGTDNQELRFYADGRIEITRE